MIPRLLTALVLWAVIAPAYAQYRDIVPPDWRLAPDEPGWTGRRYFSPDGSAWLAVYASPAGDRAAAEHIDKVLFASGEQITYQRRARNFVAVSGYKGDRIFYRKSNLACQGARWHTIALEYPAQSKRLMDAVVTRIAHGMNDYDRDCPPRPQPE